MADEERYATLVQLKSYLLGEAEAAEDTLDDDELTDALASASQEIDDHCGRRFSADDVATARRIARDRILRGTAWIDDFHTTTGLIVATDDGDDGTYSTTWAASDYELEPLDGIVDGVPGWPYYRIVPVASRCWPRCTRRAPLRVTAKWGWAAVPAPVHQACLIMAAETHKLRTAPFGVAGFGQYGHIRVRNNPMAEKKLAPYVRDPAKTA